MIAIDASVLLYTVARQSWRGWRAFCLDPKDQSRLDELVTNWAEALVQLLKPFSDAGFQQEHIRWFFEGKITKARHAISEQKKQKKFSHHLREIVCNRQPSAQRRAKKKLSAAYGRPPYWLTTRIAKKILDLGYAVDIDAQTESDHRICRWAASVASGNSQIKVSVMSVDSDYLAFSPPSSIATMISPRMKGPLEMETIDKHTVIRASGLTPLQMVIAFSLAGTDNIRTHINGMGWVKALRYVRRYVCRDWDASDFAAASGLDRLPRLSKWKNSSEEVVIKIGDEICGKLSEFAWNGEEYVHSPVPKVLPATPNKSELYTFVTSREEHGKNAGQLVRRAILKLTLDAIPELFSRVEKLALRQELASHVPQELGHKPFTIFVGEKFVKYTKRADKEAENGIYLNEDNILHYDVSIS